MFTPAQILVPALHSRKVLPQLAFVLVTLFVATAWAGVTPEIQRAVRAATFEFVLPKPVHDPLSYEKPLPLELLPFKERTDPYEPIGTAFALGHNTYLTAAHVLIAAIDNQYGPPALRASDGKVYPIGTIEKFSAHEDFAVFTLNPDPQGMALATSSTPQLDTPVFAVGSALGDGIVIRDGLLTSQTPEAQDGRWQWIRFSAAASPGNSGGPLLDESGKVIGVVTAKSPNENLNYALPIDIVLHAPEHKARFDTRFLSTLPFLQGSRTYTLKDAFALPLAWPAFERAYQTVVDRHSDEARAQLLAAYADSLFPKGSGTESILYDVNEGAAFLGLVKQQESKEWTLERARFEAVNLPGDGSVGVASMDDAVLMRLTRGNEAADDAFYGDTRAFGDLALKGLNLRREVGSDAVLVTSLGAAVSDTVQTDHYGRKWQQRVWALPYMNSYLVAMLLPTPEGYAGVLEYTPSPELSETKTRLTLLANQMNVAYEGTLAQWTAFLHRRAYLPEALGSVTLQSAPSWTLTTRRFEMSVPEKVLKLDVHSKLALAMTYVPERGGVTWDVGAAQWYRDTRREAYVLLWRQPRPPETARQPLKNKFADMQTRHSPYDSRPVRVGADTYSLSAMVQAPGARQGAASADVVYGLTAHLDGSPSLIGLAEREDAAVEATHILEHGVGADTTASTPEHLSSEIQDYLESTQRMLRAKDAEFEQDLRGRIFSEDATEYVVGLFRTAMEAPLDGSTAEGAKSGAARFQTLQSDMMARAQALEGYWGAVPPLMHNRQLWTSFLAHNHFAADTAHETRVLDAEAALRKELDQGEPGPQWAQRAVALRQSYVEERRHLAIKQNLESSAKFQDRQSKCPPPAGKTSGKETPVLQPVTTSLEEYYPRKLRRSGIEGAVVLAVRVDAAGCTVASAVTGSSGLDELDEAAQRWIETASYFPAEHQGQPTEAVTHVNLKFVLQD
jgi:TonB family protein